ncbi:5-deoxy-glucuronate isomerase [Actinomycetospora sp. NBRC 106378]|uniref:5-deoxy-glucuronate isomerase n=1 Tax=Actinomycetospora sp. NBRC 106378 TaxID=3032208 RepID=UPI0024A1F118|nr:5-deoxy-glucuronate isomerase [Actinomycetospora sp. NBRC 106378]GLZ56287.1 5-deoxy-glucuronate isomerase [Actinomycetospora sp. NBRC 106378]
MTRTVLGNELHLPSGSSAADGFDTLITREVAGWSHSSLRTFTLARGEERTVPTAGEEMFVVPLAGSGAVTLGSTTFELRGRTSVFAGPTDVVYLPVDAEVTVRGEGRFALTGARTDTQLAFRYAPAADVPVELRGAGQASRQVRNFGTVGVFETASLIACEVITPNGNWSSYPAHKHDTAGPHESELEEIYYFEIAPSPHGTPGIGYHRTSTSEAGEIDVLVEVRDRDTVLVPFGWHGPCMAAPGHDMYYLNVMAGPGPERAWRITDHPEQAWVRETWADQSIDARLGGQ